MPVVDFPPLPLSSVATPASPEELAALVSEAYQTSTPLYPIGGGTGLSYGLTPKTPGTGVVLTGLNRLIDFPARDLTVTVEAGITMQSLANILAQENLRLPIDLPQPEQATLGGVIASAWSGSRRYGHGLVRDSVIGITAIDGRGELFHGGGRVVKNVAGYDFCKLLTGSQGTLGIITQATLKLRPIASKSSLVLCPTNSWEHADELLAQLAIGDVTPVALDLLYGPAWQQSELLGDAAPPANAPTLAIGLEGTVPEVAWMQTTLASQFQRLRTIDPPWQTLADFPCVGAAPLVIKASVPPSQVIRFITAALEIDPQASIQSHAGNGVIYVKFPTFPAAGLSRTIVAKLQPLAEQSQGSVVVLSNPGGSEMTLQSTFGNFGSERALMTAVQRQFDPRQILNPGRFA